MAREFKIETLLEALATQINDINVAGTGGRFKIHVGELEDESSKRAIIDIFTDLGFKDVLVSDRGFLIFSQKPRGIKLDPEDLKMRFFGAKIRAKLPDRIKYIALDLHSDNSLQYKRSYDLKGFQPEEIEALEQTFSSLRYDIKREKTWKGDHIIITSGSSIRELSWEFENNFIQKLNEIKKQQSQGESLEQVQDTIVSNYLDDTGKLKLDDENNPKIKKSLKISTDMFQLKLKDLSALKEKLTSLGFTIKEELKSGFLSSWIRPNQETIPKGYLIITPPKESSKAEIALKQIQDQLKFRAGLEKPRPQQRNK